MVFFPPQAGRSLLILPSIMQHEKETANAISFSWRRRRDSPGGTGAGRRQPGELKNHSLDGFFPATGGPFPSHPSFFYAARKRDRKCDLFFVAEKEGFEIGHRHRPACAPRRSVRPDTISRPLKSRHRRDFSLQAAASNPSVATARNKTVHTGGLISWRRRRDSNPRASHPSLLP